jgi:hypothetical protein
LLVTCFMLGNCLFLFVYTRLQPKSSSSSFGEKTHLVRP